MLKEATFGHADVMPSILSVGLRTGPESRTVFPHRHLETLIHVCRMKLLDGSGTRRLTSRSTG